MSRTPSGFGRSVAGFKQPLHRLNQRQKDREIAARVKDGSQRAPVGAAHDVNVDAKADEADARRAGAAKLGLPPTTDTKVPTPNEIDVALGISRKPAVADSTPALPRTQDEINASLAMLGGPEGNPPGEPVADEEKKRPDPRVVALRALAAFVRNGGPRPLPTVSMPQFGAPQLPPANAGLSIPRGAANRRGIPTAMPTGPVPFPAARPSAGGPGRPSAMEVITRFIETARAGGLRRR